MKFVTITTHRSGSSFFQRCLDSHPRITARQEDMRNIEKLGDKFSKVLDDIYAHSRADYAVGFKLMYSHARPEIWEYFKKNNVKKIQFIRRNILETALFHPKHIQGNVSGGLGPRLIVEGKVKCNPEKIVKYMHRVYEDIQSHKKYADFTVYYEDDLTDGGKPIDHFYNKDTRDELLRFLGVKDRPLYPQYYTRRSKRGEAEDIVENYDELMDYIRKHYKYDVYLS